MGVHISQLTFTRRKPIIVFSLLSPCSGAAGRFRACNLANRNFEERTKKVGGGKRESLKVGWAGCPKMKERVFSLFAAQFGEYPIAEKLFY